MDCEAIRELLEAYVLGALDPDEQVQVEQHLEGCPECRRLLAEYQEVVAELPEALTAVSPWHLPDSLKTRLLQKLESNPTSATTQAKPAITTKASPSHRPSFSYPSPKMNPNYRRGIRRWSLQLVTAVFAVLLLFSIAWGIQLNVALARERALRTEVANLVGQQELVLEIVDSDKTERAFLRAVDANSAAYGKLYTRSDMPHVVAMAARLPQPPTGQAYHLWLTRDNQTDLAGVMTVDSDGFGLLIYETDRSGPTYDAAQLTLQPLGSTTPTDDSILVWSSN